MTLAVPKPFSHIHLLPNTSKTLKSENINPHQICAAEAGAKAEGQLSRWNGSHLGS